MLVLLLGPRFLKKWVYQYIVYMCTFSLLLSAYMHCDSYSQIYNTE